LGSLIENIPQARQPERGASLSPRIKIFNRSLSQLEEDKKYRPTGHRQKQRFSHREFSASVRVTWLVASENFGFRAGRCDVNLACRSQGL